jgi:hypothetical protein
VVYDYLLLKNWKSSVTHAFPWKLRLLGSGAVGAIVGLP